MIFYILIVKVICIMSKSNYILHRTRVLKAVITLTATIVIVMALIRFREGAYLQMSIDLAMVMTFSAMYLWIAKVPSAYNLASRIILFVGFLTITSAQLLDPRPIWFPTLLLLAFFLRGRGEGWIWFLLIASAEIGVFVFLGPEKSKISSVDLFVFLGDIFFEALIIDWYERNKETILGKMRKANTHLEHRVQRRTEEAEEARTAAVNALKTRGEFLANMSHEIRTPLNAINGFISLLKEDEKDEKKQEYFETIQQASLSLVETINDILDYSKIESQKTVLANAPFNTVELVDTVKLFEAKANEKNIHLQHDCNGNLPGYLNGDIQKIKQILNNLLSNAIKFTPQGGTVSCKVSYENMHLFVAVQDSGVGVEEDQRDTIFDPFTQADGTTAREFGGTGLGLAICSAFVKMMGGEINLKSQPGKGSRFSFEIPLSIVEPPKNIHDNSREDIVLHGKVLLAEDNRANQLFMSLLLSNLGLTCDVAPDGLAAVDMFDKKDYMVILMDEHMPHMSGIQATQEILKREQEMGLKHTPIIALTANALSGDKERFLAAGMDDYISKPVNVEDMIKLLKKYIKEEHV